MIVGTFGGGGGGGGGGGIAPPDFDGSGALTTILFWSLFCSLFSISFSIGTFTSGSSFLGILLANVFDSANLFSSFSFFLLFLLSILSHFSLCFLSTLISLTKSWTSASSSSLFSKLFSSSSFGSGLTFNPIALSALNSSVPIIKGNLTPFTSLSIVIFELAKETVSSSISSLFLLFLLISFKQPRDILIASFIFSTLVIWISLGASIILFSFETDSDSLSSPLSRVFSMNFSRDIFFIWFIAFKCSTSTLSIWLENLSIFLQNCWNSSL